MRYKLLLAIGIVSLIALIVVLVIVNHSELDNQPKKHKTSATVQLGCIDVNLIGVSARYK